MRYLVLNRWRRFLILTLLLIGWIRWEVPSQCRSQEVTSTKSVVHLLRENQPSGMVIRSLDEFRVDAKRLLQDMDLEMFLPTFDMFYAHHPLKFNPQEPLYSSIGKRTLICGTANESEESTRELGYELSGDELRIPEGMVSPDGLRVFRTGDSDGFVTPHFYAIFNGQFLSAFSMEAILSYLGSSRLEPNLELYSKRLFDESTVTLYSFEDIDLEENLPLDHATLSDTEQEVFSKLCDRFKQPILAMLGLRYKEQILEARVRTQFGKEQSLDDLIYLDASPDFASDLGLVRDGLLMAAALRMDATADSATTRLLPALIMNGSRRQGSFSWLGNSTLQILLQIVGNSWNEIRTARCAVYRTAGNNQELGKFCIIGVVDSRKPLDFVKKLRGLSALIHADNPDRTQMQQDEFASLLKQLRSDDVRQMAQAEIRLTKAGAFQLPWLLQAMDEATDQRTKARIRRIVKRIRAESEIDTRDLRVWMTNIWSRLNPQFEFLENQDSIAGYPSHCIRLLPDPSSPPESLKNLRAAMTELLGAQWDTVEVVQINHHFVFMFGSDYDRLSSAINLVANGKGELDAEESTETTSQSLRVMQLYADLGEIAKELGLRSGGLREREEVEGDVPSASTLATASLCVEKRSVELQLLIPARMLRGYVDVFSLNSGKVPGF